MAEHHLKDLYLAVPTPVVSKDWKDFLGRVNHAELAMEFFTDDDEKRTLVVCPERTLQFVDAAPHFLFRNNLMVLKFTLFDGPLGLTHAG